MTETSVESVRDSAGSAGAGSSLVYEAGGPLGDVETPDGRVYVAGLPVRWSDQDQFLHVNHARMVTIIEEARIPWLFAEGIPTAGLAAGAVMTELNVRYQGQIKHADSPVRVRMWCDMVGGAMVKLRHEVRSRTTPDDAPAEVVCRATIAAFDLAAQRPRRLTGEEREYLRTYLLPSGGRNA